MTYTRAYPKRNVALPATWVLARLGGSGANVPVRVREADPLRRVRSTPRWISLVAARKLVCPASWLTEAERDQVEARTAVINHRKYLRWRKWRAEQDHAMAISPDAPDILGWRGWKWNGRVLVSPVQRTPWHEASLRAEQWSDTDAVRGVAGIHARRMPCDWRRVDPRSFPEIGRSDIHGIVERFGRCVFGTEGWRAEWVVIRELMAPDTKTAPALMRRYPEVKVHVREQEVCHEDP